METEEETEYCTNCARNIPAGNFQVHQLHCVRNIITCKICNEPIAKALEESHFQEYHVKIKCSQCNQVMEKCDMDDHQKRSCSHRLRICNFCEIEIKANQFDNHIEFCGARTDPCPNCNKLVMLKDSENHQIICNQGGITDSLNKISKGSFRGRSQRQNGNGSDYRTNNDDRIENLSHVRIYEATKSNKNDETKNRNPINKSISSNSSNVDNLLSGNTPLDSVMRRYSMNVEADSKTEIVMPPSSKTSRDGSVSAFRSGLQPISDNFEQHVGDDNGNFHPENNRIRKAMHNNKLSLSNQYNDGIRKQREDRNLTQHSSSTPELPKLRYGAYKTKADTLINDQHEGLRVSSSSNGNQESSNATFATTSAYLSNYSLNINDQANTPIDVQKAASFNDEKFPHRWDRKDLSSKIYFQDTKNTTNRQAISYNKGDNDTFKLNQSELDHEYAAALQLNENVLEYQIDPRGSNRSGSSINVLHHMETSDTSPSTVHTSKISQSGPSMANVQEQLDWECAMKLHEQLNIRTPRLESENIGGHNAIPMDEEFGMQFQSRERLNAQNLEMKSKDIASGNTMQTDESYAMRLHEQLNARRPEFDSKFIKGDTALQSDEEYAMQLYEQLNVQRPELTIGGNDVDGKKDISNFKVSPDSSSNTIKYNSTTTSDKEWSRQEYEKLIDDAFKTAIDCSSSDETRKHSEESIIATTRDRENLPYTSSSSKYNRYRSQTTSEEFPGCSSAESFDDDKGSDVVPSQSQVENADVAQNDDNTLIPCEFCGKLYPGRQFKDHEELCYRMHFQLTENSRFSNSVFELSSNTESTAEIDSLDSLPTAHNSSIFQDESSTDCNNNGMKEDRKRHQFGSGASNDEGQWSIFSRDIDKETLDRQQNFTKISNDKKKSKSVKPSRGSHSQKRDEIQAKAKFTDKEQNRIADIIEVHHDINHLMPRNSKISARLGARSQLDESRELSNKGSSNDSYKKVSSNRLQNAAQSLRTAKSKDYNKTAVSSGSNRSVFHNVSIERDAKHDDMTAKSDFRSSVLGDHRQSEVTSNDRSPKRSSKMKKSSFRNGNASNYSYNATNTADFIRGTRELYEHSFHFSDAIGGSGLSSSQNGISQDLPSFHMTRDRVSSDEFDGSSKHRKASKKIHSDHKRKG